MRHECSQHQCASVRDQLLNKARAEKLDFNLLLTRYGLKRMACCRMRFAARC